MTISTACYRQPIIPQEIQLMICLVEKKIGHRPPDVVITKCAVWYEMPIVPWDIQIISVWSV